MLVAPAAWYEFVPGVTDTGAFNQHFIRDIGIIQLFLGLAFGTGLFRPEGRIWLWTVATLWLSAHAIFHLWEVAVGICSPSVIVRDFPAVSLPAIVGAMLTLWAIHDAHARKGRARLKRTGGATGGSRRDRTVDQRLTSTSTISMQVCAVRWRSPVCQSPSRMLA
jgi:hypothetical protein